ncbi:MAG TPA: L-threonylcarbamoyladenylate synthase [Bryobacteraceae bacterium]|nr:L-threonylcarbamoyladenylate synthase [Bryobacteraceae bacterium]
MDPVARAAELLRAGKLVAIPTETVYGLGANALDEAAVRRIFEAKGRPLSSPLIVHVPDIAMARALAKEWPPEAEALAERFWPGPLTIIVPKDSRVPDAVTAGLPSVGLRMPSHPVALAVIKAAGIPVAAPSANRFTGLSPTTAQHVRDSLGGRVDFIVDGGPCTIGIESTVISLAGPKPRILRPGMISQTQIEEVIGPVETGAGAESPGQHPKHYSPGTRVVIGARPSNGRGVELNLPSDPAAAAETLYGRLHELDEQGFDWIAIDLPPETPEWAGIRDRIIRAAHPDSSSESPAE